MKQESRLKEAVTYVYVGECPVDIDKVVLLWNPNCYIHKADLCWDGKYGVKIDFSLCEYDTDESGKNMRLCRFSISEAAALELIKRLNLKYFPYNELTGNYANKDPGDVYRLIS